MSAVTEQLAEQTVSADVTPGEIVVPSTARHPNELIWYGIIADAANDIRLVVGAADTTGLLIPSGRQLYILGPYRLEDVIRGRAPKYLHAAAPTSVTVTVSRSG